MDDSVNIKKSTLMMGVGAILVFIVGFYLGGLFAVPIGNDGGNGGIETQVGIYNEALLVSLDDDVVMGSASAEITMVEFSDFHCPFCGMFYDATMKPVKANYIDTGKVKFAHRDFPLPSLHPQAADYAEAAECAGEQGMYWELHDLFYDLNNEYYAARSAGETLENPFTLELLSTYAEQVGLDVTAFDACLAAGTFEAEVQADAQDGASLGVSGTPAAFLMVNKALDQGKIAELTEMVTGLNEQAGREVMKLYKGSSSTTVFVGGALPYDMFKQIIDLMD
jgi:protein-disulfide isomerase